MKNKEEIVSDCCGAPLLENSERCSACKENCGIPKQEYDFSEAPDLIDEGAMDRQMSSDSALFERYY